MGYRAYQGERDDARFFYSGSFWLKRTASSRVRLQALELVLGTQAVSHSVYGAVAELSSRGRTTSANHLKFAIQALLQSPHANTAGAIAHATTALESLAGDITGQAMTLGDYLKKHSSLFHTALRKGLEGLYGYASDSGARHGRDSVPPRQEAEYVLHIAAATAVYLNRHYPRSE